MEIKYNQRSVSCTAIMVRSWDDVPVERRREAPAATDAAAKKETPAEFVFDVARLGNRMLFGVILGGACGTAYGATDAIRAHGLSAVIDAGKVRNTALQCRMGMVVFGG